MSRIIQSKDIRIGDTIEVTWQHKDAERSVLGIVGRRDRYTHSTDYITPRGVILLTVYPSGHTNPPDLKSIRLHAHRNMTETPLPGLDELMKEVSP